MQNFEFIKKIKQPFKKIEYVEKEAEEKEKEIKMENFYKKYFGSNEVRVKKISLEDINELKEAGITTEKFLDFICQKYGKLLHGSVYEISDNKLKSQEGKIYASNKSAIAIMRALYSNVNVNLEYPYYINKKKPLVLKIHIMPNGTFIKTEKGFVYVVNKSGFRNYPKGSWQFINETNEIKFEAVIEVEKSDFKYPVKVVDDLPSK